MGIDTSGWVEVWSEHMQKWEAAIRVEPLVERWPEIRARLFGVYGIEGAPTPFAAGRGIPPDTSSEAIEDSLIEYPHSGHFGHTWILWSELEQTPWGQGISASGTPLPEDWQTLFDLMARLSQRYGAEHVRLVVWFW